MNKYEVLSAKEDGMNQSYVKKMKNDIYKTYEHLHTYPESSSEEKETSAYIQKKLEDAGYSVRTFSEHYGLTAELQGASSEVVAFRADLDAVVQWMDGELKANHSCGHDAHSTMLLYTALALKKMNIKPQKTIRFLFQPSEETGAGAKQMIESGCLQNVTELYGMHVRPEWEVEDKKASPVILHGSACAVHGIVHGVQAHASRPEFGKNAIEIAADLVQMLRGLRLTKTNDYSVKMTKLQAGGDSTNVIPDEAVFALDLRANTNEAMDELKSRVEHILSHLTSMHEVAIDYHFEGRTHAAVPNVHTIQIATQAIQSVLGDDGLVSVCETKGAEDFHVYTKETGVASTMIGLGCGLKHGLHHPDMIFNKEALLTGTNIYLTLALLASKAEVQGE